MTIRQAIKRKISELKKLTGLNIYMETDMSDVESRRGGARYTVWIGFPGAPRKDERDIISAFDLGTIFTSLCLIIDGVKLGQYIDPKSVGSHHPYRTNR